MDSVVDVSELDNSFGFLDRNNIVNLKIIFICSMKFFSVIMCCSVYCVIFELNRLLFFLV